MSKKLVLTAIKPVLPLVLGFIGGSLSLAYPAYFASFCAGFPL